MEWPLQKDYWDADIIHHLVENIHAAGRTPVRLMEVCGTHTTAIFRNGIQGLLPETVSLVSGPGCPVCVTPANEIDACISTSRIDNVIVATFGDLIRVPGTHSSLHREKAGGRDIRVVFSTSDALDIALKNPEKEVVFLGVGFETTLPTIAASIVTAAEKGIDNYAVLCLSKRIPPSLTALVQKKHIRVNGFILPGHVSVIIGTAAYLPFFEQFKCPAVIAGFEPVDILNAVLLLVRQIEAGVPKLVNGYPRAVTHNGNTKAKAMISEVFETVDAIWRGLGMIPRSGFNIRPGLARFDAGKKYNIQFTGTSEPEGCRCGDIITGTIAPPACLHYGMTCTPQTPLGPCMVSGEGTCAAYYRYNISKGHG